MTFSGGYRGLPLIPVARTFPWVSDLDGNQALAVVCRFLKERDRVALCCVPGVYQGSERVRDGIEDETP